MVENRAQSMHRWPVFAAVWVIVTLLGLDSVWAEAVRVFKGADLGDRARIRLNANTLKQRVVCYRKTHLSGA